MIIDVEITKANLGGPTQYFYSCFQNGLQLAEATDIIGYRNDIEALKKLRWLFDRVESVQFNLVDKTNESNL